MLSALEYSPNSDSLQCKHWDCPMIPWEYVRKLLKAALCPNTGKTNLSMLIQLYSEYRLKSVRTWTPRCSAMCPKEYPSAFVLNYLKLSSWMAGLGIFLTHQHFVCLDNWCQLEEKDKHETESILLKPFLEIIRRFWITEGDPLCNSFSHASTIAVCWLEQSSF